MSGYESRPVNSYPSQHLQGSMKSNSVGVCNSFTTSPNHHIVVPVMTMQNSMAVFVVQSQHTVYLFQTQYQRDMPKKITVQL